MLHQSDEKRQIRGRDAPLVERQDEIAALGGDQEVRVLDAFGDALARQHLADVIKSDKGSEFVIGDIGIDGHCFCRVSSPAIAARAACLPGAARIQSRPGDTSKGGGRGKVMDGPIPAQKEPYGVNVEAGKRYFWCACGRSATQPFCDGSHKGTGLTPVPFTAEATEEVWLCGCKATGGKPFCDGTHNSL